MILDNDDPGIGCSNIENNENNENNETVKLMKLMNHNPLLIINIP